MDKVVVSDSKSLQSFFSVTYTFDWTNDQLNEVHKRARQLEKYAFHYNLNSSNTISDPPVLPNDK